MIKSENTFGILTFYSYLCININTICMEQPINLTVYAIRNHEGKFLKAMGCGSGTWVDDINKAKIYSKTGTSRSAITWITTHNEFYPIPQLLKLTVTGVEVMDEMGRIEKTIQKKAEKKAKREKDIATCRLEQAQRQFDEAQATLNKLKEF